MGQPGLPTSTSKSPVVVKIGGTRGMDFQTICQDVASLVTLGQRLVIVHGGSAEANALGEALAQPPRFITSPSGYNSRYTDRPTLEIFTMAVNGKLNSLWVEAFQKVGVNALGLCGLDGRLIEAVRKDTIRGIVNGKQIIIRDDYTGKITHVNSRLLDMLQDEGYTPVIAPLAVSPSGEVLNVDADRAAAAVAVSLSVETLVLLTAVPGLMRRFPDESTLIPSLSRAQLEQAFEFAEGRMKKKVLGASEALTGGVFRVIIADGRIDRPISSALDGKGTVIS